MYMNLNNDTFDDIILKTVIPNQKNCSDFVHVDYIDGVTVEILSTSPIKHRYDIDFDSWQTQIGQNAWARMEKQKYFVDRPIKVTRSDGEVLLDTKISELMVGRNVTIRFDSKSIGDTLAWVPAVDDFQRKYRCNVYCSTFHNHLFDGKYDNISFIEPNTRILNEFARFRLGWFTDDNGDWHQHFHPHDFKTHSLQKTAYDILSIPYHNTRPRINVKPYKLPFRKYVCIANHSTAQAKYWNRDGGWNDLIDFIRKMGYDVVLLSKEENGYMDNEPLSNVLHVQNIGLQETGGIIKNSALFVGVSGGLSWLSWSVGTPTVMISGFTEPWFEMEDVIRISTPRNKCSGCFNRCSFNKSDWYWCPDHKGTNRQFECTRSITVQSVIDQIQNLL